MSSNCICESGEEIIDFERRNLIRRYNGVLMSKSLEKLPKVSFIIPTLNRERTIENCLKSIKEQAYPNIEIIIVDGGSRDKTMAIASKYATKIIRDNGSLGKARQHGAEESTGEILGIFDSDVILPTNDWLYKAVQKFYEEGNIGVVWPFNKAPQNGSIVSRCYFSFWRAREAAFNKPTNKELMVPGGNCLILRRALEDAGGFNQHLGFGEDLELGYRIIRLGYRVAIFADPLIHDTMWSLKEYTRKQIWGASALCDAKNASVTNLCISWRSDSAKDRISYCMVSAVGQIITGIRGIISGLHRDKDLSCLLLPILLGIRVFVYSGFFLVHAKRFGLDKNRTRI